MTPTNNTTPFHFKPDRRGQRRSETLPRRTQERLYGPCKALVRGVDANGQAFTETTTLENVSAGGLYMKLWHEVPVGSRLFVVFAFSSVSLSDVLAPKIAALGEVRRSEMLPANMLIPQNGGKALVGTPSEMQGIGLRFQRHRFL